jgi:carbon storage regulator CsrA
MLVFSRCENERVECQLPSDPAILAQLAGATITVTCCSISRERKEMRIGFDAPQSIIIHRQEVADTIRQQNPDDVRAA